VGVVLLSQHDQCHGSYRWYILVPQRSMPDVLRKIRSLLAGHLAGHTMLSFKKSKNVICKRPITSGTQLGISKEFCLGSERHILVWLSTLSSHSSITCTHHIPYITTTISHFEERILARTRGTEKRKKVFTIWTIDLTNGRSASSNSDSTITITYSAV